MSLTFNRSSPSTGGPLLTSLVGLPLHLLMEPLKSILDLSHQAPQRSPPALALLSPEIHLVVLENFIDSLIYEPSIRQYRLRRDDVTHWRGALVPLLLVSKSFGTFVLREWNRQWPASRPTVGWELARPVVFFERFMHPLDLSVFAQLRFASLDFRHAFKHQDNTWHLIPLVARLPRSLEAIEFLRVHVSALEVIKLVAEHCPMVKTLRVVFCTMFNNPDCTWWAWHQHEADHGHYLLGHDLLGVRGRAEAFALALGYLTHLRHLHLGVYFLSFEAVHQHRSSHRKPDGIRDSTKWLDRWNVRSVAEFEARWSSRHPNVTMPDVHLPCLARRSVWEVPCQQCVTQWKEHIENAERLVVSILAAERPLLKTVSFASFVADKRTSPSEWGIVRRSDSFYESFGPTSEPALTTSYFMPTRFEVRLNHINESGEPTRSLLLQRTDNGWDRIDQRKSGFRECFALRAML